MVSLLHEAVLLLVHNRPALAAALMSDVLGWKLPFFEEARVVSADLTDIQPAEYRADMVIELFDGGRPVFAIILEVQLSEDPEKHYSWPAYVANLYARLECQVCLLVFTADESVARWAATPFELGGKNWFVPHVIGPSGMPAVTDEAVALANPELAVLSAMAHGRDADVYQSVQIAMTAQRACRVLDDEREKLYCDLTVSFLAEAARNAQEKMQTQKYEYQSAFAQRWLAEGKVEGKKEGERAGQVAGRSALIARLLTVRFGAVSTEDERKLLAASIEELDAIGERLLTARSLQDALAWPESQAETAE